jgi:hypothetical protein
MRKIVIRVFDKSDIDEGDRIGVRTLFHWCCWKPMSRVIQTVTANNGRVIEIHKELVGWICMNCGEKITPGCGGSGIAEG